MFFAQTFDLTENDVATFADLEQLFEDAIESTFLEGDIAFVDTDQSPLTAELDALISAGGLMGLELELRLGAVPTNDLVGTIKPVDRIPAVSTMGLIVTALLVLTAGTIVIVRRRQALAR